jgi:hypothetical protein
MMICDIDLRMGCRVPGHLAYDAGERERREGTSSQASSGDHRELAKIPMTVNGAPININDEE